MLQGACRSSSIIVNRDKDYKYNQLFSKESRSRARLGEPPSLCSSSEQICLFCTLAFRYIKPQTCGY